MESQLSELTWLEQYPLKKYARASDDISHGSWHVPLDEAMTKRYIQTNPKALTKMIVLDCDFDDADRKLQSLVYDDGVLPEPNWITVNPETTHAHAGYFLTEPVTMTLKAHYKPINYLARVDAALRAVSGADMAYTGAITRNPLYGSHTTIWGRTEAYSLDDLRKACGDSMPDRVPEKLQNIGFGRHDTLFTHLRFYSYSARRQHKTFESFYSALELEAGIISVMFASDPLPLGDIRSTVKSVAQWTWRKHSDAAFLEIQKRRGRKGGASMTETRIEAYAAHRKFTLDTFL